MKKILDNLYMFESKTNVLLYKNKKKCILIDTGKSINLKSEIKEYIDNNKLKLKGIINTHAHSDHVSNNDIENCKVYANKLERTLLENYTLQLDLLYGGKHPKFLENSFLSSKSFKTHKLPKMKNIKYVNLEGHSYNMIGVIIENKVIYIGDALFSEKELKGIPYIYDIEKHLNTIEQLKKYKDLIIISPHCGIINNLEETINQNKEKINKTKQMIINMCKKEKTINDILEHIIKEKQIELNKINYYPITATIRSFISYLLDKDIIEMDFKKNNLYYKTKNDIIK